MKMEDLDNLFEFVAKIDQEMEEEEKIKKWSVSHSKEFGWTVRLILHNEQVQGVSGESFTDCLRALSRELRSKAIPIGN